jgi:hypothetical protein
MKKGLPKCVCAPNCKATAAANKIQQRASAKIAVIQMPETKTLRRNEKSRLTPSEMQNDEPTLIDANVNRRQGLKRLNQSQRAVNNEALIYSPLINANIENSSTRNATQEVKTIETKIRGGFFGDQNKFTSYNDGFYIGKMVNSSLVVTENLI